MIEMLDPVSVLALLLAGGLIGLVGGLLGIGGGVIAVPVLLELFADLPPAMATALAIGTSQAVVLFSAVAAAAAHARAGTVDGTLLRLWMPGMVLGAGLGLAIEPFAPPGLSVALFALITALLGARMLMGTTALLPGAPSRVTPPALIGMAAAGLGIGAGTLSGPVLGLYGVELRRVIGLGAVFNLVVALPATIFFLWLGWHQPGLPADALGHVSLIAFALLALPAMLVAPAAARLAQRLPQALLRRAFALCLFAISARMLYRLVG